MQERPSVILVREWEQQMSSGRCCGPMQGDFLIQRRDAVFPERRAGMESLGPLYQAIRARFGSEIDLHVVDPRNLFTLLVLVVRDCWRSGRGLREAARTLSRMPVQGVIVNGRIYARGTWPEPDAVLRHLEREQTAGPLAPTG